MGSGRAWAGTTSDLRNMFLIDFWCLSNGGAVAPAGSHRFGSKVRAMTVSSGLHFLGRGTLEV